MRLGPDAPDAARGGEHRAARYKQHLAGCVKVLFAS
jgi:hypothetical protein